MSLKTVEVELDHGQVRPTGPETLPAKARALLTLLTAEVSIEVAGAGGSLAERVAGLAGIGRGEHGDLSTNKSHLDDFGR